MRDLASGSDWRWPETIVRLITFLTVEPAPGGGACFESRCRAATRRKPPEESPLADAAVAGSSRPGRG